MAWFVSGETQISVDEGCVSLRTPRGEARLLPSTLAKAGAWDTETVALLQRIGALDDRPEDAPPRMGDHRLLRVCGHGAFSTVWQAVHVPTGELRAVKVLRDADPDAVADLKQEVRAAWRVDDLRVVVPFGLERHGDTWFVAMEWIGGGSMLEHIDGQPHPTSRSTALMTQFRELVGGVVRLHQLGLVHGDIKPSNVLVRQDGSIALVDLGFSVWQQSRLDVERVNTQVGGTPLYLAPEVALGEGLTPSSDWYAVGAMLYEAIAGQPPHADLGEGWLQARLDGRVASHIPDRDHIPPAWTALAQAMVHPDPRARPSEAEVVACVGCTPVALASPATQASIGRKRIHDALDQALEAGGDVGATMVLLSGTAGIGRSVVLEVAARRWEEGGALVLRGHSHEHDRLPFRALDGPVNLRPCHAGAGGASRARRGRAPSRGGPVSSGGYRP